MKRTYGAGDDEYLARKKNAFRFPKDPEAIIPKHEAPVYIDKRSAHIPVEYRYRPKGVKACKIEEQRKIDEINNALQEAEMRFKGEKKGNIDLKLEGVNDNMELDEELNKLAKLKIKSKAESKKEKKSKIAMDEDDLNETRKTIRAKKKKQKKSKSYYIVNH